MTVTEKLRLGQESARQTLAMKRMGRHYIPEDLWEMPGTCKCGRPVVVRRRPWRWCMPDTNRACDHR